MPTGLLIRLRPTGAWRIGPESGDRDRVDRVYHSDSLYSALTHAMAQLGSLEEWLEATARAEQPAVRLGSCFPFQGDTLYVAPPRNLWPPPASSKVRWKGARFVPLSVVEALAAGRNVAEDRWMIDGASECLVPMATPPPPGPFRVNVRSNAAADRTGVAVAPHSTACLEFTPSSGLWTVAAFSDAAAQDRWTPKLTAAFRLLADSGFGGERSRGWGRAEMPEITSGELPGLLMKSPTPHGSGMGWWLLSLFHPAATDTVDWAQGNYALATRGGRVESSAGWGEAKKATRMVTEGSVIVAASEPTGSATDVAPEGFAHPVYRAGFAFAIPIPFRAGRVTAVPVPAAAPAPAPPPVVTEEAAAAVADEDAPAAAVVQEAAPASSEEASAVIIEEAASVVAEEPEPAVPEEASAVTEEAAPVIEEAEEAPE